nr:hypothetical protein [bacterium]
MSIILFVLSHSLFKNATEQRKEYNSERLDIQSDLISLRDNIWEDNLDTLKIRSKLRQALYSYRNRYWFIAFPFRLFHIQRSLHYIKKPIPAHKKEILCKHIDYLIGNMDKKEIVNNEH